MKKLFLVLTCFLFLSYGNVTALTLEEAISESLTNNLNLKIEDSSLDIVEESVLQSKADFLPTISLSGSLSETETTGITSQGGVAISSYELSPSSKSIILSQTIFNGFGRTYSLKSNKSELELQ
ncbi:uncharacterized protein METZ01_LOCUS485964, partial [marine metagenome]